MKITFWADYACPFCYIGETALKQAIENLGIKEETELEMKAFELEPEGPLTYEAPTAERNARRYGYPVAEIRRNIEEVNRQGQALGLDMHYDKSRYTNTFDAHRLTKLAQSKGNKNLTEVLQESLFKAYFTDSLELANHKVLTRLAAEAGLNTQEVSEMLFSDLYANAVRSDEEEARAHNVSGVPFFVINSKYIIPDALSVEKMEKALLRVKGYEEVV